MLKTDLMKYGKVKGLQLSIESLALFSALYELQFCFRLNHQFLHVKNFTGNLLNQKWVQC